jgi:YqjK-like protein
VIDERTRTLLAMRRELLVQRAALQRAQLAQSVEPWLQASARVDRGLAAWRGLREQPALLAFLLAPAALLALWRPRAVLRVGAAVLGLWRIGRSLRRTLKAAPPS